MSSENKLLTRRNAMNRQKSFYPKGNQDNQRNWYLCNAADQNLGRLATQVARILMGKNKPTYTPSVDMGDYVIVTNSKMVNVTGNKHEDKKYYRHTGYPGGLRETTFKELQRKYPDRIISVTPAKSPPIQSAPWAALVDGGSLVESALTKRSVITM